MQQQPPKKTFSTMELVVVAVIVGSLILSFWQALQEEKAEEKQRVTR